MSLTAAQIKRMLIKAIGNTEFFGSLSINFLTHQILCEKIFYILGHI